MFHTIAARVANPNPDHFNPADARRDFLLLARLRGLTVRPENLGAACHRIRAATCPTVADLIEPHRANAARKVQMMLAAALADRMTPKPDGAA